MTLRHAVRYVRWLGVTVALTIAAAPRVAFAHARLVKSRPAAGAHLSVSPKLIQLWYSEAAEATMTTITVTGPNGAYVTVGPVNADGSNPLLLVTTVVSPLPAGEYTVSWRTIAKDDGHPSDGSFAFVVDGNPVRMAGSTTATDSMAGARGAAHLGPIGNRVLTASSMQDMDMDVEAPSYVLARWLYFVALITVIGVIAFRVLVVPRVIAQYGAEVGSTGYDPSHIESFANQAIRRAATLGLIAGVTVLIAAIGRLYAQRAVIGAGMDVGTILHSFWGHIWFVQFAVAIVVCITFAMARASQRGARGNWVWPAASIAVLIIGATPALSGHPIAAPEHRNLSVALDIMHVIAAGGWLGTLFALALVGVPAALAVRTDPGALGSISLIARLVNAFSPLALVFAGIIVVSGVAAAWLRVGSLALLFHSTYGTVLMVKLGFVVLAFAGGAFNWLRMRVALSHRDTGRSAVSAFRRSAWIEIVAGVLVIAATAVLVAAQPPVH